jgi:hypothetical protein
MSDALSELRAKVSLMRELGVLQWDGLILGPPPAPPEKDPPKQGDAERELDEIEQRQHKTLMALKSSGVTPSAEWLKKFDKANRREADE